MRDRGRFENLLERIHRGESPAEPEWALYRDRKAILITDLSGFTRRVREAGNEATLGILHAMRKVALPLLKSRGGILVKYQADDLFAAFAGPEEALHCALDLMEAVGGPLPPLREPLDLCMGIGYGDVLWWADDDLYGLEVNLASKLGEDTAGPREILLTRAAAEVIQRRVPDVFLSERPPIEVGGTLYPYYRFESGLSR